ncbi:hypothetical protein GQ457_04G019920 [Hibiscus cannabinus]
MHGVGPRPSYGARYAWYGLFANGCQAVLGPSIALAMLAAVLLADTGVHGFGLHRRSPRGASFKGLQAGASCSLPGLLATLGLCLCSGCNFGSPFCAGLPPYCVALVAMFLWLVPPFFRLALASHRDLSRDWWVMLGLCATLDPWHAVWVSLDYWMRYCVTLGPWCKVVRCEPDMFYVPWWLPHPGVRCQGLLRWLAHAARTYGLGSFGPCPGWGYSAQLWFSFPITWCASFRSRVDLWVLRCLSRKSPCRFLLLPLQGLLVQGFLSSYKFFFFSDSRISHCRTPPHFRHLLARLPFFSTFFYYLLCMAESLLAKLGDLNFTAEEQDAVVVVPEIVANPAEDFACSLVGRVLSSGPLDGGRVARLFHTIWKDDKQWFALEPADPARTIHDYTFHYMCIWVRIHKIPLSLMTEALAHTLGACIGKLVMTDTHLEDGNMGEFLRVRISLDNTKPLRRCVTLSRPNAKAILCPLQYERVPIFCHGCGLICHVVLQFPTTPQGDDQKLQYGAWLRCGSAAHSPAPSVASSPPASASAATASVPAPAAPHAAASVPAPAAPNAAALVPAPVGPATSVSPVASGCDATVSAPLPAHTARDNAHVAQEEKLIATLRQHKEALGWTIADIKGISQTICMHRIILEDNHKPTVDAQRRLNQSMKDVVRKEILKWLDAGIIYPISDSEWVSPVQCVPKKGGMSVISNEKNELIPTRTVTGWRVSMDYRKLNKATRKDHFPLPFIDQMLDKLAGKQFYSFLDGYSGYNQIAIAPEDQSKTTFTCPYRTFAFRRMPFGLCNAPATFQRCMTAIFSDLNEDWLEIFMDDFTTFGENFDNCLSNLEKVLIRCKETNLLLNWEKCHFMVDEGIVLGHKISSKGMEVDKEKIEVISKLPPPTIVKGIRNFLGHAGFYRRFIEDFS